jgi:hypothetical protein
MYIVEFRNRVLVFVQWAMQDLTFSRGARLITGPAATDFDFNKEMAFEESDVLAERLDTSELLGQRPDNGGCTPK